MVLLFYTTYNSVDLANHERVCAKVAKGGILLFLHMICRLIEHSVDPD